MSSSDRVRDQEEARSNHRIYAAFHGVAISAASPHAVDNRILLAIFEGGTDAKSRFRRKARCGAVGGVPKKREPHLSLYRLHSPRNSRATRVDWHGKGLESWRPLQRFIQITSEHVASARKCAPACAVTTTIPLVMAEIEKRKIFREQSR